MVVATRSGIKFARTAKILSEEKRWGKDNLEYVQSTPWRKYKEDYDVDGESGRSIERGKGS